MHDDARSGKAKLGHENVVLARRIQRGRANPIGISLLTKRIVGCYGRPHSLTRQAVDLAPVLASILPLPLLKGEDEGEGFLSEYPIAPNQTVGVTRLLTRPFSSIEEKRKNRTTS